MDLRTSARVAAAVFSATALPSFRISTTSGRRCSHSLRRLRMGYSSACMTLFRNFFTFTSPRPPR